MSEQQARSLYRLMDQQDNQGHTPLREASVIRCWSLGDLCITLDDPDFLAGYQEGNNQYHQWHQDDRVIEGNLLLFLLHNGWGGSSHSEMWQTGYIVGWLFALFAQAAGTPAILSLTKA